MTDEREKSELYRRLTLVRKCAEKIMAVYLSDVMQTPVHLSVGQESIATALCYCLNGRDFKIGTHRSHALYLSNGGDVRAFFAELLGRKTGCSGGMGGSMHLIDTANGLVGTTSIVGGCLPILPGLAMACEKPQVAAALFGDGACDEGALAESLNWSALKKLPAIFLCENNRYSVYTPFGQRRAARPIELAKAFGLAWLDVPIEQSSDVFALAELLAGPIERVRQREGPLFVECQTVRALDHSGVRDDVSAGLRPAEEKQLFETYDPMKVARTRMNSAQCDQIDAQVAQQVELAYQQALADEPATWEAKL